MNGASRVVDAVDPFAMGEDTHHRIRRHGDDEHTSDAVSPESAKRGPRHSATILRSPRLGVALLEMRGVTVGVEVGFGFGRIASRGVGSGSRRVEFGRVGSGSGSGSRRVEFGRVGSGSGSVAVGFSGGRFSGGRVQWRSGSDRETL